MRPEAAQKTPAERGKPFVIDCTPSWRTQAEWCLIAIDGGSEQAKDAARAEIRRMGDLIDNLLIERASGVSKQEA